MFEDANSIFDYLPIRYQSVVEDEYQWYLWNSFSALIEDPTSQAPSFALMPFHMLFMLAVQYKVLRLSKVIPTQYCHAFTFRDIRNHQSLLVPTSPYDFCNLNESTLFDIFRLVNADDFFVKNAKSLVKSRNDLAHSNGAIEANPELNVQKYLEVLKGLQIFFVAFNDGIAQEWIAEMEPEDNKSDFVETRLAASHLCPADFLQGNLMQFAL